MNALRQPDLASGTGTVVYPESDGQPMGETDVHISEIIDLRLMLRRYFRSRDDVYVGSNLLVYYVEGDPTRFFVPDVFVAFGVDTSPRRTYKLWEEGRPPSVVIEVSSRKTWLEDQGNKKSLCAHLGVEEYYLYDPEGDYLDPRLQGFRLAGTDYAPMPRDDQGRLRSDVLGLTLALVDGRIELRRMEAGEPLLRPDEIEELAERAAAAEAEVDRLRAENERLRGEQQHLED